MKINVELQDEKEIFGVVVNSDLTEGCGYDYTKYLCEKESTAIRLAKKANVQGSDGSVVKLQALRLTIKANRTSRSNINEIVENTFDPNKKEGIDRYKLKVVENLNEAAIDYYLVGNGAISDEIEPDNIIENLQDKLDKNDTVSNKSINFQREQKIEGNILYAANDTKTVERFKRLSTKDIWACTDFAARFKQGELSFD